TKPRAKAGHNKQSTSSKQPPMSSSEAINNRPSKAPTGSKIGLSMKRKESCSAKNSNLSQPLVFTHVDTGMHKEDQQAAGGPTSLGVTNEERAHPQLSSGSIIIYSESASEYDASVDFTAEADP
nr:hypothetical protein [Tanacetum cinerariifolium]